MPEPTSAGAIEIALRRVATDTLAWQADPNNTIGRAPGGWLLDWARSMFEPPKVDWRRLLAREIRTAVARGRERVDWAFGPPSRRRAVLEQVMGDEAPILPVLRGPEPRVAFVLDVSGSMAGPRVKRALSEALGLVRAAGAPCVGLAVDAQVHATVKIVDTPDLVRLNRGGGGTDMAVGVRAAAALRPTPELIVVLTDGETPWWTERDPGKSRVVTMVVNNREVELPEHVRRHAVRVTEE